MTYIKSLEDATGPGDDEKAEGEDENEEVEVEAEVHREERVNMNKESSAHKCLACDKIFKAASDLNRHLKDKQEHVECPMCKKSFSSRKQAEDHICLDGDIVPLKCDKTYCNKEIVSSAALNKHIKNSHYGHQRKVCNERGEILDSNTTLNKHI